MTTGAIDDATVARLAALAEIDLDPSERAEITADLAQILGHAAELATLDLEGVDATAHVDFRGLAERRAAPRLDVPCDGLARDVVLAEAPRADEGAFVVPAFVDEG